MRALGSCARCRCAARRVGHLGRFLHRQKERGTIPQIFGPAHCCSMLATRKTRAQLRNRSVCDLPGDRRAWRACLLSDRRTRRARDGRARRGGRHGGHSTHLVHHHRLSGELASLRTALSNERQNPPAQVGRYVGRKEPICDPSDDRRAWRGRAGWQFHGPNGGQDQPGQPTKKSTAMTAP